VPEELQSLLLALLTKDPQKRLGSKEAGGVDGAKNHPFFAEVDWERLSTKDIEAPTPPGGHMKVADGVQDENWRRASIESTDLKVRTPVREVKEEKVYTPAGTPESLPRRLGREAKAEGKEGKEGGGKVKQGETIAQSVARELWQQGEDEDSDGAEEQMVYEEERWDKDNKAEAKKEAKEEAKESAKECGRRLSGFEVAKAKWAKKEEGMIELVEGAKADGADEASSGAGAGLESLAEVIDGAIPDEDRKTIRRMSVELDALTRTNTKMEIEVKMQKDDLFAVIDLVRQQICAKGRDGKYILVNKSMADKFGRSAASMVGRSQLQLCTTVEGRRDAEMNLAHDQVVMNSGERSVKTFIVSDTREGSGMSAQGSSTRTLRVTKIPYKLVSELT
jgi:PAS domain-containing protein